MMTDKQVSAIVLETRQARGMTQEQFGEQLGVSKQAVCSWEQGDRKPGAVTLMGLLLKHKDWRLNFAMDVLRASGLLTE